MIFRQIFDTRSSTYTYLIASREGGEGLLIDPVKEHTQRYIQLIRELQLDLAFAIDTHIHADHITGLGDLRRQLDCVTAMGEETQAECVSMRLRHGEELNVDGVRLTALHTPGHTDDSYSFLLHDDGPSRLLTGDTLLIRGTGRTDFQNGDPGRQYDSLFERLLRFPDETRVYPAHDYNGMTVSTIGEEKRCNPRLQVGSRQEYIDLMNALKLDDPKLMDIAVPANRACGLRKAA